MKFAFGVLALLVASAQTGAKELFFAKCVPAITKGTHSWRVEETKCGLMVRYKSPKREYSAEVTDDDATALRSRIVTIRLSQADVTNLESREVKTLGGKGEELLALRPFDGFTYYFTISAPEGVRRVIAANPDFDLEHHAAIEETARLREALELLRELALIAQKIKTANSRNEKAPSCVSLMLFVTRFPL